MLSGADLTATALLSYPLPPDCLHELGRTGAQTPYVELGKCMREFVSASEVTDFINLTAGDISSLATRSRGGDIQGPPDWVSFVRCLDAVQGCGTLTSVAVTKILHRKRPTLVPINDSRLRGFYGTGNHYSPLFRAIWEDIQQPEVRQLLASLSREVRTLSGRPLTVLRALDIVIWMHQGRVEGSSMAKAC
ncbi:MAG: DUF6308 family protein [Acidimicrobiales bacterium]